MSFIFADSMSHYASGQIASKYDIVPSSGFALGTTTGRFGNGGFTFSTPSAFGNNVLQKSLPGHATCIINLGWKNNTMQLSSPGGRFLTFLDGGTAQVLLHILDTGQIRAYRATTAGNGVSVDATSANVTLLVTSTGALSGSFQGLEIKVVSHASTGSITIKKDGATFLSLTGLNTAISGTANIATVAWGGYERTSVPDDYLQGVMSDVVIMDGSGSSMNDFIGDVRVELLTATGAGNYAQWTPSASTNVSNIDDAANAVDGDTTYNSSNTTGNKDSFVHSDSVAPTFASVKAVIVTMYAKKNDGGSNQVKALARLSGTDANGNSIEMPSNYGFVQSVMETKPGGGAWTVADVNGAEFGYEKV